MVIKDGIVTYTRRFCTPPFSETSEGIVPRIAGDIVDIDLPMVTYSCRHIRRGGHRYLVLLSQIEGDAGNIPESVLRRSFRYVGAEESASNKAPVRAILVNSAGEEVTRETYPSPDKARELRVVRTSEGRDLTVKLLQDQRVVWSRNFGTNTSAKLVVSWHPDSSAVLIVYSDSEEACRLLVVGIRKERIYPLPVYSDDLRDVLSLQADKVTWERDGSITLALETKTGGTRRRIQWSVHAGMAVLAPVETGK